MPRTRKPWYRSKTVWFNVLFVASVIFSTPGIVDPKWAALAQGIINVLLRVNGGAALSQRKPGPLDRPLDS